MTIVTEKESLSLFVVANSLSCATHVKDLSRYKALQIGVAVVIAQLPFIAASATTDQRNLQFDLNRGVDKKYCNKNNLYIRIWRVYNKNKLVSDETEGNKGFSPRHIS